MLKKTIIRVRATVKLRKKLELKAKKYGVSYADLVRTKLNNDDDEHLFI